MTSNLSDDYIIIGAGAFGVSTALHLQRKHPACSIALVDREPHGAPTRRAASWDWNKVVRADYMDAFYAALALEAKRAWAGKNDDDEGLFAPFYHESGAVWIAPGDMAGRMARNYEELGTRERFELVGVGEARRLYAGLLAGSAYEGVGQVLVNRSSGWAEAKEVLGGVIGHLVSKGLRYQEGVVSTLEFGEDGSIGGVRLDSGLRMCASKAYILCTGARTAKLLADSAPDRDYLQVNGRLAAAAVCTGLMKLQGETAEKILKGPVVCQHVPPGQGGSVPLPSMSSVKFWSDMQVKNTIQHPSGRSFSSPPDENDYAQWAVPETMKEEVRAASRATYGPLTENLEIEDFRICWDAFTSSEDWIISPHPACSNLYVATAGAFHGWKFFPIVGKYVVKMLDGELDEESSNRWAWDRERPDPETNARWPKRELRDLK